MKIFSPPVDLSRVETLVYHLPNGSSFSLKLDGINDFFDLDLEIGHICDTSEIDGVLHFFPKGNA